MEKKYFTQTEAQELDRELTENGYSMTTLIELAGFSAFEVINDLIKMPNSKIRIFIGPGNNGADGLVIARYLLFKGHYVTIFVYKLNRPELLEICIKNGADLVKIQENGELNGTEEIVNYSDIVKFSFVIDALFGFSFVHVVRMPYDKVIESFKLHSKVISIDVPSGYSVDSEDNEGMFKPMAVVALTAPKICCKKLNTYLARAFSKGGWENFDGYVKL